MEDLSRFDIVISPSSWTNNLLKKKKDVFPHDFKIISKEELKDAYFGTISKKAIWKVAKEFDLNLEISKMYLDNVFYFNEIDSKQFEIVKKIKEYLLDNNLITEPYDYYDLFKDKNVLILGYGFKDSEIENILNQWKVRYEYAKSEIYDHKPDIYHFASIRDEVFYLFNYLLHLNKVGEDLKNYKVVMLSDEYKSEINWMANQFNLPNQVKEDIALIDYPLIQDMLKNFETFDFESSDEEVILDAYKLYLQYHLDELDRSKGKEILISLLKTTSKKTKATPILEFTNTLIDDEKKTIILGLNQGSAPKVIKDIDLFSDEFKIKLGLSTSLEKNENERYKLIEFLSSPNIIYASYKLSANSNSYYPSSLISELSLKDDSPSYTYMFDNQYNKIVLGIYEDELRKYGRIAPYYSFLKNHYKIDYLKYDNLVTPLEANIKETIQNYSYSRIKKYFLCSYAYYLSYILKLNDFEDTFATKFGKIAHSVLEKVYDKDFSFEDIFALAQKDYEFALNELLILDRLKEELEQVCKIIRRHYSVMNVVSYEMEKDYKVQISNNVYLNGIIDKIIVTENQGKEYYAIIDNKTGSEEFKEDLLPYGISMQLPIYSLLIKDNPNYSDKTLLGMYIQPLHVNKIGIPIENKEEFYLRNLKLQGLTLDDLEGLKSFDPTYSDSNFIKSLKTLKSGEFRSSAKVVSPEQIKEYQKIVIDNILKADQSIRNNEFDINPKVIDGKNVSCPYCPFVDICSHNEKNEISISLKEGEEDVD